MEANEDYFPLLFCYFFALTEHARVTVPCMVSTSRPLTSSKHHDSATSYVGHAGGNDPLTVHHQTRRCSNLGTLGAASVLPTFNDSSPTCSVSRARHVDLGHGDAQAKFYL
jgi:hypothetical protein